MQKKRQMSNSYKYDDSSYTYIDPKTGVLKNLRDIKNPDVLLFVESALVTKRLNQLYKNPIKIKGIKSLFDIHKHLFQDIYSWAGKARVVEINKDGKQFFATTHFENAYRYINSLIGEYRRIDDKNQAELAKKLSEILDSVNYLHPFRDGNGRAQREFLRLLALEKNLILNLNPPDNVSFYNRYMTGTVKSDLNILTELIFELIKLNNE